MNAQLPFHQVNNEDDACDRIASNLGARSQGYLCFAFAIRVYLDASLIADFCPIRHRSLLILFVTP